MADAIADAVAEAAVFATAGADTTVPGAESEAIADVDRAGAEVDWGSRATSCLAGRDTRYAVNSPPPSSAAAASASGHRERPADAGAGSGPAATVGATVPALACACRVAPNWVASAAPIDGRGSDIEASDGSIIIVESGAGGGATAFGAGAMIWVVPVASQASSARWNSAAVGKR